MFSLPSTSMLKYFWEEPATLIALQEYLPASFGVALKSFNIFPLFTIWIVLLSVTFKGQNAQCYFLSQLGCIIKNSSKVFIVLLRRNSHDEYLDVSIYLDIVFVPHNDGRGSTFNFTEEIGQLIDQYGHICDLFFIFNYWRNCKKRGVRLHTLIINITYKVSLLRPLVSKFYQICALKPAGHIVSTCLRKWKVLTNVYISNPYWIFLFQSFELRIHFRINWRENLFILQIT